MGVAERKARENRAREAALLAAAVDLFDGPDWEAVTVEQIALRAEHAKGTVYKHFASKDELYAQIALDRAGGTLKRLEALDLKGPLEDDVRAMVRLFWTRFNERGAYARLATFVQRDDFLAGLSEETRARIAAVDGATLAVVRAALDRAAAAGEAPAGDPTRRLFAANALLMGALRLHPVWAASAGPLDAVEETVAQAILAVLRAERI